MSISFHAVAADLMNILDEAEVQGTAAVLIALKFCYGGLSSISAVKSDDTGTPRPTAGLILDLSLFNFADSSE